MITGIPASLTTSTVAPPLISSTSAGTRVASFWSNRLTTFPAMRTSRACASVLTRRVSSAATTSAVLRLLISRAEASAGIPSGVAASSNRPGLIPAQPTIASVTVTATEPQSAARSVPVISPGPLMPVADFGPVDRLNGWAMTAVITRWRR